MHHECCVCIHMVCTYVLMTLNILQNILAEAIDKYYLGIPPVHWLPWIPQLLMSLVRKEGQFVLNLLCHIGKTFPQVSTVFSVECLINVTGSAKT